MPVVAVINRNPSPKKQLAVSSLVMLKLVQVLLSILEEHVGGSCCCRALICWVGDGSLAGVKLSQQAASWSKPAPSSTWSQ